MSVGIHSFSTIALPPAVPIVERLFDMWGVHIALRADNRETLEAIVPFLPVEWRPGTAGQPADRVYTFRANAHRDPAFGPAYDVTADGRTLERSLDFSAAVHQLAFDLEAFVTETSPRYVIVHAGVVAWGGRAIVIPGRSFSGKSTLTAALLNEGARYFSDEYALVDDEGFVHPFRRPLHLRQPTVGLPPPDAECWAPSEDEALRVALVVLTHFDETTDWQPLPICHGDAVLALFANTMSAQKQSRRVLQVLDRMLESALPTRSPRGDARKTAAKVMQVLSRAHPPAIFRRVA